MTNPANNDSDPQDDDLQKALAAFGDDVLDLLNDDDDDLDTLQNMNEVASDSLPTDAPVTANEATRNQRIDELLNRFEAKFGQESTLGYAGSVAVACSKASSKPAIEEARSVVFSIGTQLFALPLQYVPEIARCGDVTPLPRTANWLCGVTNLRGELLPIIDPRLLFQLPAESQNLRSRHQKLIVTQTENDSSRTGLLVDRISGIHALPTAETTTLPEQIQALQDVASGTSCWNDQMVVLLDPAKLFSHHELQTYAG